uniref:Uncharacterized protein n=1 Tax=Salix viminalis TaxID=40686 RepID=A0A6N2K8Z2_SALVM
MVVCSFMKMPNLILQTSYSFVLLNRGQTAGAVDVFKRWGFKKELQNSSSLCTAYFWALIGYIVSPATKSLNTVQVPPYTSVTPAVPYMLTGLARCSVGPKISCGARNDINAQTFQLLRYHKPIKIGTLFSPLSLYCPPCLRLKTNLSKPISYPHISFTTSKSNRFKGKTVVFRGNSSDITNKFQFLDENGVVDDMDGYLNYLSL